MHPDRLDALTQRLGDATSRRGLLGLLGAGVAGAAVAAVSINDTQAKSNHGKNRSKRDKGNNGKHKNDSKNSGSINRLTNIPITAHDQQGHNFEGVLNITEFSDEGGQLVAHGTVTGKVTGRGFGNRPAPVTDVVLPVSFQPSGASVHAQATCNILDLYLGPIDLDLLGLILHVNQIHIHLTANPAGGLLGSLLCSIANLLSTNGALSDIVAALNDILAILQGL